MFGDVLLDYDVLVDLNAKGEVRGNLTKYFGIMVVGRLQT